jgi:biotin synthase
VRLSSGEAAMSAETKALCFLAGANSILSGEKLLTAPNPGVDEDAPLVLRLGMRSTSNP